MIVVMRTDATKQQIEAVRAKIRELGYQDRPIEGVERTVVCVLGQVYPEMMDELSVLDGVETVLRVSKPYKLASREVHPMDTVIRVGDLEIGAGRVVVMAGQCSVDTEEYTLATARAVKEAGAHVLRGGAFKPRTSPHSFEGHGAKGLELLAKARAITGLPIITEVMDPRDVELVAETADILQIGSRNGQNFALLKEVGRTNKPVLLKRGMWATVEEWLLAAEHIMTQGNHNVILCERGIRTFETATRFTFDVNAIPFVKRESHLPVIADPSHGTGRWYLVEPVALAAIAAGADGLIIEVHVSPDHALSDGAQSLTPQNFARLMQRLEVLCQALGRPLHPAVGQQPAPARGDGQKP
ncbi:MAG: 3-deoxy-7-phosphoheptulonate synthase [Dehalococcoidia bacterium]|jgi:3-deoxy-7-phosphoheptulonate synthase|nr:3-deoxy-7-phosphoheptulonate synthase [Dehalococcoidia bacterium]MDW8009530.1 3-deoxy-7-phosphoheptulonate synthase [Chloroflexota bacterium]